LGSVNERQLPAKLAALTFMGPEGTSCIDL